MRKHGGTPSRRDKHVTLAAISPPGVARGRFVGGQQSGLAGSKPPPLFTRGASSCSSQGRRQGEPLGASPRPSVPAYLPEAREERRYSERGIGTAMENMVANCEGACRKRCGVAAEESDEVTSGSSGSKTRRYRKRFSPKQFKGDGETAMDMTPSPVRRMFSAASDFQGYHTSSP